MTGAQRASYGAIFITPGQSAAPPRISGFPRGSSGTEIPGGASLYPGVDRLQAAKAVVPERIDVSPTKGSRTL
jgi:hypothetical protein